MGAKSIFENMWPSITGRRPIILPGLLVLAVLIVYLQTAGFDFVRYDDELYVTKNPHVLGGLTRDGVVWALTTLDAGFWHPLTWLSLMADRTLFGMNAGGYHVTNLLLHLSSVLLLFYTLRKMTGRAGRSAVVAGIFALHPLHVESVAWVAERKDVLSGLFFMLGMWAYTRYAAHPRLDRYGWVVLFFVMGLLSKAMVVTFPFVLLLLDQWPLRRMGKPFSVKGSGTADKGEGGNGASALFPKASPRELLLEKIPFFILAIFVGLVTLKAQSGVGALPDVASMPLDMRLDNALVSYVRYLWKTLWPVQLAVFYPHPLSWPVWQVVLSAALLAGITLWTWRKGKAHPYLPVGWLWFLGTLLPVIGVVQLGSQALADRYAYLPLIGLAMMAVWGISDLAEDHPKGAMALTLLAGCTLLVLTIASFRQTGHWQNSRTLFSHAVSVTEGNYLAHNNLGADLLEQGDDLGAAGHFLAVLKAMPRSDTARVNLGKIMANRGRYEEAAALFHDAIRINPAYPDAKRHLADVLLRLQKTESAIALYREALLMKPGDPELQNNLAVALAAEGRIGEALSRFRKAVELRPDYGDARRNLEAVVKGDSRGEPGRDRKERASR